LDYAHRPAAREDSIMTRRRGEMRQDLKQTFLWSLGLALLLTLALALGPNAALAQGLTAGANVYEMNENAKFRFLRGVPTTETSTSQFMGFVSPGTPLCPQASFGALPNGQSGCVINVTGTDRVSLATGLGPINGKFTVVTADLFPAVDSPETVVMKGTFSGKMDFSPALQGRPFGTVSGHLTINGGGNVPFFGVFLLPFGSANGCPFAACYLTYQIQNPVPQGVADVLRAPPFVAPVQPFEFAIGYPTARFDIYFQ
jgi:hypothetical protein